MLQNIRFLVETSFVPEIIAAPNRNETEVMHKINISSYLGFKNQIMILTANMIIFF